MALSEEYLERISSRVLRWAENNHNRALKRRAYRKSDPSDIKSLAARSIASLWPWNVDEYPSRHQLLAGLCGVSESAACGYLYKKDYRFPAHRARRLASQLEAHCAQAALAIAELRAYASDLEARGLDGNRRGRPFPKRPRSSDAPAD